VLAGLSQERKASPARHFHDYRGSQLFEQITGLPEYYPTRVENAILTECCAEIAEDIGADWAVVEFGAGSAAKTALLLDCIEPSAYVPVDLSSENLGRSRDEFARRYPDLTIFPVVADFARPVAIPAELDGQDRLGFFPGSTIGNFETKAAVDLLRSMRETLGDWSMLLIGMDLIKDHGTLISAYDDTAGVTAEFNLNLAARINRELDGTIPIEALRHRAIWNAERERIEMHLEALYDIGFHVCGRYFTMLAGETIHTENNHKYDERSANQLLTGSGWDPVRHYFDPDRCFMVILARADPNRLTP